MKFGEISRNHNHRFILSDTDSVTFCKEDGSRFTEAEEAELLEGINSLFPENIRFESNGQYDTIVVVAAKNYVLHKVGEPLVIKGSGLKATLKERRLKRFIDEIINVLIHTPEPLVEPTILGLYNEVAREIMDITDITDWCTKKTITSKILKPTRTNEIKVLEAIGDKSVQEGDKIYTYFKNDGSIGLDETFDGDYSKEKLLEKLYKTVVIFKQLLNITLFPNYKLKRNQKLLMEILEDDSRETSQNAIENCD